MLLSYIKYLRDEFCNEKGQLPQHQPNCLGDGTTEQQTLPPFR